MNFYRSFIAFQLPQKTLDYCFSVKEFLIKNDFDAKWTKSRNLHITINFMGNRTKEDLLQIAANIRNLNTTINQICFGIDRINMLGSKHSVLCLKIIDMNNNASNIVNNILISNNLTSDYEIWLPHITLARIKTSNSKKIFRNLNKENFIDSNFKFSPTSVNVYISYLTHSGPIYKKVTTENEL